MNTFCARGRGAMLKHAVSIAVIACTSAAQAQVINFDTEVIQMACTPDLNNSGAPSAVITLPEIKVSTLGKDIGQTAGETAFIIGLSACGDNLPANTLAGVYFYGQSEWADGESSKGVFSGRLTGASSDGGYGWHYQLLPADGDTQLNVLTSAAKPSDTVLAALPVTDVSTGSGTLNYRVRYYHAYEDYGGYRPSQINPGTRTAEATYVLFYR